jgi:hypothetical protein
MTTFFAILMTMNLAVAENGSAYSKVSLTGHSISGDRGAPGFSFVPSGSAGLPVRILFKPRDGSMVDPASIRVRYGIFNVDITKHVLTHGTMDSHGISIDCSDLPVGKHRVTLEVLDTLHRRARIKMRLMVSNPVVEVRVADSGTRSGSTMEAVSVANR